jgi:hypothetical protein
MIQSLPNDLRYGAKMLWKSKGLTIVAIVSLAVGIGANSAIFSLVNSILPRGSRRSIDIEGYQPGANEDTQIAAVIAGPGYFTNMRVPIVQGRDFEERDRDGAPCVAIVNEAFGQKYFRGANALGKHLLK